MIQPPPNQRPTAQDVAVTGPADSPVSGWVGAATRTSASS